MAGPTNRMRGLRNPVTRAFSGALATPLITIKVRYAKAAAAAAAAAAAGAAATTTSTEPAEALKY